MIEGIRSELRVNKNAADAANKTRFSRFRSRSFEIARTLTTANGSDPAPQATQWASGRRAF